MYHILSETLRLLI